MYKNRRGGEHMAKGKKRPAELPEYGTVMMKGVQYYRTRITDADGKRVAIYGLTREELYDRVEDAQKKIAEVVFHRENPTVEEYCEKWLLMRSGTVRTNTLEGYARMVNRYIVGPIGQMYMDEVTTDDLRLLMIPLSKSSSGMLSLIHIWNWRFAWAWQASSMSEAWRTVNAAALLTC